MLGSYCTCIAGLYLHKDHKVTCILLYYAYFINENMEAQRGQTTEPSPQAEPSPQVSETYRAGNKLWQAGTTTHRSRFSGLGLNGHAVYTCIWSVTTLGL